MNQHKPVAHMLFLLLLINGCYFQQSTSYLVDLNLHTGRFDAQGGYSGSIVATLESHDQTLLFLADISLKSGELSVDVIKPDGDVFKSLVATKNGGIKIKEEMPSILGEWKLVAKSENAKGHANLSFKTPMEDKSSDRTD